MTRVFALLAATGFVAACMSNGTSTETSTTMNPNESTVDSVAEPTDGFDNELADDV